MAAGRYYVKVLVVKKKGTWGCFPDEQERVRAIKNRVSFKKKY